MSIISLIENYLEIVNILISIFIILLGISVLNCLEFKLQKRALGFFLMGVVFFAIAEILIVDENFRRID